MKAILIDVKNAAKAPTIACKIILPVPGSKYACALVVKIKKDRKIMILLFILWFLFILIYKIN